MGYFTQYHANLDVPNIVSKAGLKLGLIIFFATLLPDLEFSEILQSKCSK